MKMLSQQKHFRGLLLIDVGAKKIRSSSISICSGALLFCSQSISFSITGRMYWKRYTKQASSTPNTDNLCACLLFSFSLSISLARAFRLLRRLLIWKFVRNRRQRLLRISVFIGFEIRTNINKMRFLCDLHRNRALIASETIFVPFDVAFFCC